MSKAELSASRSPKCKILYLTASSQVLPVDSLQVSSYNDYSCRRSRGGSACRQMEIGDEMFWNI